MPWVEGLTDWLQRSPSFRQYRTKRPLRGTEPLPKISDVSPCFTPGTLIATERGQIPVEMLKRGDKVVTRDNGLRRIYWVGRRDVTFQELAQAERLNPVLVRAGALGDSQPSQDMLVSPNHRFLSQADRSPWDESREEALIAAKHLVDNRRVQLARTLGVSYVHILCDRHQVILANGAWTESFHPDDVVLKAMGNAHRLELMDLFPDIATIGASVRFSPVRRILERSRFER